MIIDPFRLYRRHKRLVREALDEAQYMRRRYGDGALTAARERQQRPDLSHWGRKVMKRAVALIARNRA